MFADTALAKRIESVEARLTQDDALTIGDRDGARAFARAIGGGVAAYIRPGSPINKVIGAGIDEPLDEALLAEIEALYHERDEPVRVELSTLAAVETGLQLTKRGYRLHGFENVLGRSLEQPISRFESAGIQIERITEERLEDWKQVDVIGSVSDETGVIVDSFTQDVIAQAVSDLAQAPSYDRYIAIREGIVAGAASMRLDDGIASFTGAATLPEHRRQGVQNSLLARRLSDARHQGAEIAVITTSVGTRSQANAMRRGFGLLYSRAILILDREP